MEFVSGGRGIGSRVRRGSGNVTDVVILRQNRKESNMATKQKKNSIPEGFEPVSSKMGGFFIVREGNQLRGILRDSFVHTGQFGAKRVYKVELTADGTAVTNSDSEEVLAEAGDIIGLDEKGYLKALGDIEKGAEIFVRCTGKGAAKKGQNAPWTFDVFKGLEGKNKSVTRRMPPSNTRRI